MGACGQARRGPRRHPGAANAAFSDGVVHDRYGRSIHVTAPRAGLRVLLASAAFVVLFALLFLGVPIAFGLVAVGFVRFALLQGFTPALHMVGQLAFSTA